MKISFADVLRMHEEAYISSQDTRRKAADDLLFARVTQWDDPYLNTTLEYRGQFDQIRKARRQNLSEMRANPVQVSYIPGRDGDDNVADIMERKYRFDMSTPAAKQAALIAQQDQLDCGVGAWRLVTDYENSMANEQYIRREPIHEANNRVFRDPNCIMPDGSDARYCSVIWSVTELGWPRFAEELGLSTELPNTFEPPEDSGVFPWSGGNKIYNISEFYYRAKVTKVAFLFENILAEQKLVRDEDFDDISDELVAADWAFIEEREYETYEVRRYWVAGGGFLVPEDYEGDADEYDGEVVAGTEIPIVTVFGEVSKVEGQWVWEGIVRLAKDPQRLRNFMMSYIADIAAKGARQRPYFRMSQIQGLEWQFEEGGPDQNRPFRVLNDFDEDGNPLEGGPVAYEQPPEMPTAAAGLLEAVTGAIDDVTNPGIPQDIAGSDLSGKAVLALQNQLGLQMYTYLDNFALALQREAEIYASMFPVIYDTQRDIGLLSEDGTEEIEEINAWVYDPDSARMIRVYDVTKGEYKVRTKVQPAYSSRKDQQRASKIELYAASQGNPEAQNVILLEIMMLDESENDVSKKYARQRLLDMGLLDAESEEDQAYMQKASEQPPKPDPMMIAANAEMEKATADREKIVVDKQNADTNQFEAQTKRYSAMVAAKTAGADLDFMEVEKSTERAKAQRELAKGERELAQAASLRKESMTRRVSLDLATGALSDG